MRILFLYDFPLWGSGSGIYLRNLIQELVKQNHKIGIVAPEARRFLDDKIRHYQVKSKVIPVFIGHPELKGAKRYSELSDREITNVFESFLDTTLEAVENFQPDIIHVHHLSIISWVARYIKALKNIKYIVTTHGSCFNNLLVNKKYMPMCEDAIRNANAITTVSGNTRSRFLKIFGKGYSKNFFIIPGGIDMKMFPVKPNKAAIKKLEKKYKIEGKKVVLFCGRLTSEKGAKYLISAAKDIQGEVLIVGDGPERQFLNEMISRKNLKNVHLLGYMTHEKIIDLYYRADVFVAPSVVEEALGLSILEAMAARTPVIATRKGGIPLLVKQNHNGLFVKPRNSEKISNACNKLINDDNLRKKMGEAARKTVEEKFTWDKSGIKFNRLYKNITGLNGKNGKNGKNGHHKK